jgi:hypothetical protein
LRIDIEFRDLNRQSQFLIAIKDFPQAWNIREVFAEMPLDADAVERGFVRQKLADGTLEVILVRGIGSASLEN